MNSIKGFRGPADVRFLGDSNGTPFMLDRRGGMTKLVTPSGERGSTSSPSVIRSYNEFGDDHSAHGKLDILLRPSVPVPVIAASCLSARSLRGGDHSHPHYCFMHMVTQI